MTSRSYIELLSLTLSHPYIDGASWRALPGAGAEAWLARMGLKAAFSRGRLRIYGPENFPEPPEAPSPAGREEESALSFFLFCDNPYLIRASDWPVYQPGRELLFFDLEGEKGFGRPKVMEFSAERLAEVNRARKKYLGRPYGPPPFGLASLPEVRRSGAAPLKLELNIATRDIFWIYEIAPKLGLGLALRGGPSDFRRQETEASWRFVSEKPVRLAPSGVRGVSLMMEDGAAPGGLIPLLENLPGPVLGEISWNQELNDYAATVAVDLSRFGLAG